MALRIRRMTVYETASLSAGQTGVRTKAVRCRGAAKVAWILRAGGTDSLAAAAVYGTMDEADNAAAANFQEIGAGALGAQLGVPVAVGDMAKGGTLVELGPSLGGALCLEQAEMRFDSHAANAIPNFKVVCEIHDEVGADVENSLAISTT